MKPKPMVFLDTETTGLHEDRRAWEIALVRREDGITRTVTIFIDVRDIPPGSGRSHGPGNRTLLRPPPRVWRHPPPGAVHLRESEAMALVAEITAGAELYGLNPLFDTECLEAAMRRHGRTPNWWHTPVDIAVLARGFVIGQGISDNPHRGTDRLSAQCGVQSTRCRGSAHRTRRHLVVGEVVRPHDGGGGGHLKVAINVTVDIEGDEPVLNPGQSLALSRTLSDSLKSVTSLGALCVSPSTTTPTRVRNAQWSAGSTKLGLSTLSRIPFSAILSVRAVSRSRAASRCTEPHWAGGCYARTRRTPACIASSPAAAHSWLTRHGLPDVAARFFTPRAALELGPVRPAGRKSVDRRSATRRRVADGSR